ncbi:6-phosphogluconolactonase [Nocardioides speluncae]|uniref:6-phosphogluconolactonase n=1 Tax=Nocardioides speluncae TaxID=2670337 RepID=UPI000D69716C|nr:6-phosphogluconolactonase [Nocardioides speluncae]
MTAFADPTVKVLATEADVVAEVATALVTRLAEIQSVGRVPAIVLTGGTIAALVHAAVAVHPRARDVDWTRVEIWYGDERYVAADSPDRNAVQARESLLDHVPVNADLVHEMPAADGPFGPDLDAAAAAYASTLRAEPFDIVMLGMGPDGHCASLFPGFPQVHAAGPVVPVTGSPKPPPERLSLTIPALSNTRDIWFLVSGDGKADAAARALARDARVDDVPASGPRGLERTVWYLDTAAAAHLR